MPVNFLTASIPAEYVTFSYFWAFVLGAIIGSFLNVYIYRFHTGKSLAGSSHCLSCGEGLRWYELFPVVSYLLIRGKCRHCSAKVPVRYLLVELMTACLFVWTIVTTTVLFEILLLWAIVAVLVVIVTYDFYHFIIPDAMTIALSVLILLLVGQKYLVGTDTFQGFGIDLLASLAGASFFLFLWLISKGEWLGFGDVKLAVPLGLLVGAESVFSFIVLSFWIGAAVSIVILAIQRVRRGKSHLRLVSPAYTMKSAVPFAPFLIAGAVVTFFAQVNVLSLFNFTI